MTISEFLSSIFSGSTLALVGAALAVLMAGMGSAKGVNMVAKASAGALSEDPSIFGKTLLLQALPMTQGFYGFIVSFLILFNMKAGIFGDAPALTVAEGAYYLVAALPTAIVGYYSAVKQGEVATAGVLAISKRPGEVGKAVTSAALVETYAILAALISILLVF